MPRDNYAFAHSTKRCTTWVQATSFSRKRQTPHHRTNATTWTAGRWSTFWYIAAARGSLCKNIAGSKKNLTPRNGSGYTGWPLAADWSQSIEMLNSAQRKLGFLYDVYLVWVYVDICSWNIIFLFRVSAMTRHAAYDFCRRWKGEELGHIICNRAFEQNGKDEENLSPRQAGEKEREI